MIILNLFTRSAYQAEDKSYYLPYKSIVYFYGEYEFVCDKNATPIRAKLSTFRRAYVRLCKNLKQRDGTTVKFQSGKGSFDKCDICVNADELLRHSSRWSPVEMEIIRAYRRRHINQQFEKRIKLQENILSTYEFDEKGQPVKALLFTNGMTVVKG